MNKFASLTEVLRYRAIKQSNKLAYTFLVDGGTNEVSVTYQELDQKAQAIATQLKSVKVTGERVILLYPPGLDFIAAFFGCLYAGAIAVPVYPPKRRKVRQLQAITVDAQAKFMLTTTSVLTNIEQSFCEELAALRYINTDNIDSHPAMDWQEPSLCENLAFLQYTSGSTGKPKGVMVSHRNLLHNLDLLCKCFEHSLDSQGLIWLPPYHDMGLIGGILQPLYSGFKVILMSPVNFIQKPIRWLEAISRYKATTSGGPNFAYDLCVQKIKPEQRANLDLSTWEVAFTGAEPIRAGTLERFATTFEPCGFRKEAFYPCYGMAEATLMISGGLKSDPPTVRHVKAAKLEQNQVVIAAKAQEDTRAIVSVGKSWIDQKIVIADPEFLTVCPAGKVGEIWVSGTSVAGGYWNQLEQTKQTFHAYLVDTGEGAFLRTGDLGFLHDGELFITGRIKDLIVIRGKNHYPQDIEITVEKSHPALRKNCGAAFTVEVNDEERLIVVQEVERSCLRDLDVNDVVKNIRQAIFQQHELQVYAVVLLKTTSIPKSSSGKIQRHSCRVNFLDRKLDIVGDWTMNNKVTQQQPSLNENECVFTQQAIENWLVYHLASYLKVPLNEIDIRESFAAYGLDSSVAVSTTMELAEWLGCELEPTLFWQYPSIKTLAQYLEEECQSLQAAS